MDSTTIDLCLKLFPWADFRSTKAAVKAHTVIDLRGAIPVMLTITTGKIHDVKARDALHLPVGSIVVLDRGYVDLARLHTLVKRQCSFVVRGKDNLKYESIACAAFNAVKSQIWIAVCVYMFEKISLKGMVSNALQGENADGLRSQEEIF